MLRLKFYIQDNVCRYSWGVGGKVFSWGVGGKVFSWGVRCKVFSWGVGGKVVDNDVCTRQKSLEHGVN